MKKIFLILFVCLLLSNYNFLCGFYTVSVQQIAGALTGTLTQDLHFGSLATVGSSTIDGQNHIIFLDVDLTVTAGITFSSTTTIDGQGHEIVFGNDASFNISGTQGTNTSLTLRNCILRGVQNFLGGSSIVFGTATDQSLYLNDTILHLAGNYNFGSPKSGYLGIKNDVRITGSNDCVFEYDSAYPLNINSDSTLFLDNRTVFEYNPATPSSRLIVMQDATSRLFLNGCTLYLPGSNRLILTNGNLIIDHKTTLQGDGLTSPGLDIGSSYNISSTSDLLVDLMPGADFQVYNTKLHYNNFY